MNTLRTSLGMFIPALLLVSSQVIAAEFTLRIQHFLGDDSLPHKELIEPWARRNRLLRWPIIRGSRLNPADA